MSYELSIWDHKDNFIHLLKGEYSFEGSAFKTTFVDRVNGNSELSFSIPMYISDKAIVEMDLPAFLIEESGDLTVSNEDSSKAIFSINDLNSNLRHSIENPPLNEKYRIDEEGYVQASFIDDVSLKINPLWLYVKNEYKIRLVRFKGTDKEKIYDFVIKNFSESRTYDSRTIDVQCKNYAIHELSRLGYSLTINEETPIKNPPPDGKLNIQYWMEIILPYTKNQYSLSNPSGWTFELEGGTLKDIMIPGYDKDGDLYTPRSEIIKEKERIMKIERSNVFNIIQELCEKFEVWANFEYEYDSYGKIIGRKIIFKSEVESNAEYSITYGINAGDMSKESNSDELSTKIIVENVESDLENSGVMSFSECPQNLMMENFIYNFDYYQQAGFISEEKNNWVKTDLAYSIRNKNVIIKEKQSQLAKIKNDYESVAADLEFVTYELAGSQESLQDAQSKSSQYSIATVSNTTITYQTVNRGAYSYINLNSRRGVLTSPAPVVRTTAGSIISISLVEYDANNPKYIVGLRVPTSAPDLVRVTLSYNSYNYYQDLVKIEQNKQVSLNLKKSKLSSLANNLQNQILSIENEIKTVLDEKQLIIDDFENEFYSIIKEGSWKDDGYRLRVEENSISNFLITQTVVNEPTNSYIITTDLNNIDFSTIQCFKTDRSFTYYDKADFTINYGSSGSTRVLLICPTEDGAFALERLQSGGSTLFSNNSQILVNYKTLSNELKTVTINRSTTARKVNREYIINAPNVLSSTIKIFPVNGDDALLSPEDYTTSVEYDTVKITLNTTEAAKHIANYYKLEYETNITSQFFYNDAISVAERSAFPEVSYSIAAVDISEIEGFEGFTPKTGQKILINDRELWLVNQYGFLSEISYDLDNPAGTQLTISNYKTRFEDLFQRIVAATQQITLKGESLDRVLNAIPPSGIIVPGILQKSIDENGVLLRNSINNEVTWGAEGITLTDKSETDKTPGQVRIVGGGIFLSDSIDSSGNRIWRTGITPKGFNASEITTGSLNTGRITIWDESNPRFMWNSEGLYAYATDANFTTDFNKFIRFNSDGIVSYSNYSTGVKTFEIKSDGSAYFSGTITIKSGSSGIGNLSDAGLLATKNNVGVSDLNSTVISGGYIITSLLTANNIVTGTLKSQNNYSWINLNDGKFSFGNGALSWSGSALIAQGSFTSFGPVQSSSLSNGAVRLRHGTTDIGYFSIETANPTGPYITAAAAATSIVFTKAVSDTIYTAYSIIYPNANSTIPTHTFVGSSVFNGNTTVHGNTTVNGSATCINAVISNYGVIAPTFTHSGSNKVVISGSSSDIYMGADMLPLSVHATTLRPSVDGAISLGQSDRRWYSVWAVLGTIQTSGLKDKENIKPVKSKATATIDNIKTVAAKTKTAKVTDDVSTEEAYSDGVSIDEVYEEDFIELLDLIAAKECTYNYKVNKDKKDKTIPQSAIQLGVIADEISDHKAYKYIGVKEELEDGTINHGLQPLPVAMLAIQGYKKLRDEIKELKERIIYENKY